MLFGEELNAILKDFYDNNKNIVHNSLIGSLINFTVDSIILPRIMAKLFVNIKDKQELKNNVTKLIVTWVANQFSHAIADTLHSKLEPALTKYLTDVIVNNIFIKYQNTNKEINASIIFSKISTIRWNIETLIDNLLLVLIPRIIIIYFTIFNFYMINKKIGICALFVVTIQLMVVFSNFNKCINIAYDEIETRDEIMDYIEDKFNNIHTINSVLNGIKNEVNKCQEKSKQLMDKKMDVSNCVLNRQISGYSTNSIVFVIILLYSYDLHKKKELDTEQFITLLTSLESLFIHVYEITYIFPNITAKMGVLNSNKKFIAELFSHKPKNGTDFDIKIGQIKFNNVTFGYEKNTIFNSFNVEINNGITAIYGPSGSGKSTFVKLICDIIKPQSGSITIDGIDVNKLSHDCLNKNIIYISQNTSTLFNATVYENLIYGLDQKNNVKNKLIQLMLDYKLTDIFSNINKDIAIRLNKKFDNNNKFDFFDYSVGKKGEMLSGGQRQMIHIIRSILNYNSKIFIYDEPTSALDNDTKNNVIKMIKNELKNKTVLLITHDHSIKQHCDQIINFKS
jgi:ABC-type multidrug transport system fused ATPase/permease subunit